MIDLYPPQRTAVDQLKTGSILCGGVGSGKSRTSLAYYYKTQGGNLDSKTFYPMGKDLKDLYIITTAAKRDKFEWDKELSLFMLSTNKDLNYYPNTVVIDSWNNIKKYVTVKDAFFIFDEDRVTGSGVWVKSFLKIARGNDWIILSATPGDTWLDYIPVFIANGFYKSRSEFELEHVRYNTFVKYKKVDRYYNTGRLMRLRRNILVDIDILRNTKQHHEDVIVPYDVMNYRLIMKHRWNQYTGEPVKTAAELCYLLRRVVNVEEMRSVKILEIFEDHPRLIIFYNFDYELDILKNLGYGPDVQVAEWNGHKHQEVPDSEKWVYLVQYTAGAEGWNCVKTDTIIFYSQNYSYKVMTQAAGRIDRINTRYTDLYYYHLKSRSPIDMGISDAVRRKKKFNEMKFVGSA